ncbi:MAG TPA: DUF4260 domain-containing protein [Terracidiphilus sp.]|nr:DUF4260 domain-containing protein [Terracidiphilus sp.]
MASKTDVLTGPGGVGPGSIRVLLRMEGLAVAAIAALLYARVGVSWWLFAGLWLVPDLSMLGYLTGACRGAKVYNVAHSYVLPAILGLSAYGLHQQVLLAVALVWANHIGLDRALGYGLKYGKGFGWTHLGRLGGRKGARG